MTMTPFPWTLGGVQRRLAQLRDVILANGDGVIAPEKALFCHISGTSHKRAWELWVFCSGHFFKSIMKERLTGSALVAKALLNLRYGYDPRLSQSRGGKDGIFRIDEDFRPSNSMVRKLYNRYLGSSIGQKELACFSFDLDQIQGVRVVSHGLRLLGFAQRDSAKDESHKLLLVDIDVNRK